jgi:hypothetical protein
MALPFDRTSTLPFLVEIANAHISKLMKLSGPSWAAPEVSYRYVTHGSPPRAGYYLQG